MKQIAPLLFAILLLLSGRLLGGDRLIVHPGAYTEETMAVSLVVEEVGTDQIRFTISYRPKPLSDGISRSVSIGETHGVAAPLKTKRNRWAFCIEGPNIVWFYDGAQRLSLWTVNRERGLSRVDSTVEKTSGGPLVLRKWIRN